MSVAKTQINGYQLAVAYYIYECLRFHRIGSVPGQPSHVEAIYLNPVISPHTYLRYRFFFFYILTAQCGGMVSFRE